MQINPKTYGDDYPQAQDPFVLSLMEGILAQSKHNDDTFKNPQQLESAKKALRESFERRLSDPSRESVPRTIFTTPGSPTIKKLAKLLKFEPGMNPPTLQNRVKKQDTKTG